MGAGIFSVLWTTSLLSLSNPWMGLVVGVSAAHDEVDAQPSPPPPPPPPLTRNELETLVDRMRGDDVRIVRWDATSHTRRMHKEGGCDDLPRALDAIVQHADATTSTAASTERSATAKAEEGPTKGQEGLESESERLLTLACEYLTFCLTDNPSQRDTLSQYSGNGGGPATSLYHAVVSLIEHPNPAVSAGASHVVYSATFAHKANHWGLHRAGVVAALANVILRYPAASPNHEGSAVHNASTAPAVRPDQAMWAAAALQNVVASYCATKGDGRCYWHWSYVEGGIGSELQVAGDSLPVVSEGTSMRLTALSRYPTLTTHLAQTVCQYGPVRMENPSDAHPHPGVNARIGLHESSSNLVAWAAAGAIKNLALDPLGRKQVQSIESWFLPCLCYMSESPDWLEENKGHGALERIRFGDPCWFDRTHNKEETTPQKEKKGDEATTITASPSRLQCIDGNFRDAEGYHCGDYVHPGDGDCDTVDFLIPLQTAAHACCTCGGGMRFDNTEATARQRDHPEL